MTSETTNTDAPTERPVWPAMRRGWARRCPNCGTGHMMKGYLKVADHCPNCGEDLSHQRADDGPAYLTILVVGHIVMFSFASLYFIWQPSPYVTIAILWSVALVLTLYLLPRFKGALVALQWAKRMHGFGGET